MLAPMLTKPLLLTILAACSVHSEPPDEQPIAPPDQKDHVYFCCQDVDPKTFSGEGCLTIGEKEVDRCSTVLACSGNFTKKDGVVTCD
jgi:hypothetical protein